jgi:hypothetical protein
MDPVVAANHRWLAGCRHPRCGEPATEARLLDAFVSGLPLIEGAEAAGDPIATLPPLFHLMWRRELLAAVIDRWRMPDLRIGRAVASVVWASEVARVLSPPLRLA